MAHELAIQFPGRDTGAYVSEGFRPATEMIGTSLALKGVMAQLEVVNAGALPQSLIENELFGRDRGAYTGAHARRRAASNWQAAGPSFSTRLASCRSSCSHGSFVCFRRVRSNGSEACGPFGWMFGSLRRRIATSSKR